jgi:N utilization substance protein B
MANRHLARSLVLQTLFERDLACLPETEMPEALSRNIEEFGGVDADIPFTHELLDGIIAKMPDLDKVIIKAAPEWPLERIAPIDRNILRIGLYELLFGDRKSVPSKVAINEAIELAKVFGGDSSSRFVNGVLGAVYRELGSPGKDDSALRPKDRIEELPIDQLIGGIVYTYHEGRWLIGLVHDIFGHWTVSKGHVKPHENADDAMTRILKEEMDVEGAIGENIGHNEYIAVHPEKGRIRKRVDYYLVECSYEKITLKKGGGLDDARWFRFAEILSLNLYDDVSPIIMAGMDRIFEIDRKRREQAELAV